MIWLRELPRALISNYIKCFNKSLEIKGRASRFQFWGFIVVALAIGILLEILYLISEPLLPLVKIYIVTIFLPTAAVSIRRLHDINKSAWTLLWTGIYTTALYFIIKMFSEFFIMFDIFGVIATLVILLFPLVRLLQQLSLRGNSYENDFGDAVRENKIHEQTARYLGIVMIVLYFSVLIFPMLAIMYKVTGTFNILPLLFP